MPNKDWDAQETARALLRIGFLCIFHVAALVTTTWLARNEDWPGLFGALQLGVILAQVTLLGLWVGFSRLNLFLRLGTLVTTLAGIVFMTLAMMQIGYIDQWVEVFVQMMMLFIIPASLVVATCMFMKRHYLTISRPVAKTGPRDLRFNLRHLVLVTVTVATVLTVGRMLRTGEGKFAEWFSLVVAQAILMVALGLGATWAALGQGRIWARLIVVVVLAAVAGAMPAYFTPDRFVAAPTTVYLCWSLATAIEAIVISASLLVIRRGGYCLTPVASK